VDKTKRTTYVRPRGLINHRKFENLKSELRVGMWRQTSSLKNEVSEKRRELDNKGLECQSNECAIFRN
jgi:hypothetical protein